MTRTEKIKALKLSKPIMLTDIVLFGLAIILIVTLVAVSVTKPKGNYAAVRVHGEIIDYYSLNENGRYTIEGGSLTLIIENGCAFVGDSKCPDHYCEKMGRIKLEGQQIICLPQGIVIEITTDTVGGPGGLVTG